MRMIQWWKLAGKRPQWGLTGTSVPHQLQYTIWNGSSTVFVAHTFLSLPLTDIEGSRISIDMSLFCLKTWRTCHHSRTSACNLRRMVTLKDLLPLQVQGRHRHQLFLRWEFHAILPRESFRVNCSHQHNVRIMKAQGCHPTSLLVKTY